MSYVLDEDSYAEAEVQDVVRKRFIRGWEPLIDGYKVCAIVFTHAYDLTLTQPLYSQASLIAISKTSSP